MYRKIILFPFILLSFLLSSCSVLFLNNNPEFIKVNGSHFELSGKPYYFFGTNLWYGCYLGSSDSTGDRGRLVRELDKLKSIGVTNLRILGASEKSYIKISLKPEIQTAPNIYNENLLEGLDFLLSEMGKRNMHAVIILNNYWEWSGGMAQYNDWANPGSGVDPGNNNYSNFMDYSATFYSNMKAQEIFNNYIYTLITRKNKYNGVYYYDDPTIMSWQLANEPRPGRSDYWIDEYYRWIETTAQFIHLLDHNHLVSSGSEGIAGSLQDSLIYLKAHRTQYIDYLTFHLWAKNWDWFDAKNIQGTYPETVKNAVEYINKHISLARQLNKPVVMEEFGLPRDNELYQPGTATTARDKYFKMILTLVYDSASAGAPIAGSNVWAWGGEARSINADFKWRIGDPFLGDPPQEPQGLNSIYDTDLSTISIFKSHSEKMNKLNERKPELQISK